MTKVKLRLLRENKKVFNFFKVFGIFLIKHDGQKYKVNKKLFILTRFLWLIWHFLGMVLGLIFRMVFDKEWDIFLNIMEVSLFNLVYVMIDPVQTLILKRELDFFPSILNDVRELEQISVGHIHSHHSKHAKIYLRKRARKMARDERVISEDLNQNFAKSQSSPQISHSRQVSITVTGENENADVPYIPDFPDTYTDTIMTIDSTTARNAAIFKNLMNNKVLKVVMSEDDMVTNCQSNDSEDGEGEFNLEPLNPERNPEAKPNIEEADSRALGCVSDCWNRLYSWLPRIIFTISITTFLIFFTWGFYQDAQWMKMKNEWHIIIMFYNMVFPILTTWFCIAFLEYQRKLYLMINKLDDKLFSDPGMIKKIAKIISIMQRIFKKMNENIYRYTFGINFLIFNLIGVYCTYELMLGFKNTKLLSVEMLFIIPLSVCIFHLYISCKRSNDLVHGQHDNLKVKLKNIMVNLLMEDEVNKFRKVDLLYRSLSDWPPQPLLYGRYRINNQTLTAMLAFIFGYAGFIIRTFTDKKVLKCDINND